MSSIFTEIESQAFVAELSGGVSNVQATLKLLSLLGAQLLPEINTATQELLKGLANPGITELQKIIESEAGEDFIKKIVSLVARVHTINAHAKLANGDAMKAISEFKATKASIQFEAFKNAGFNATQSLRLVEQQMLADALREAVPSKSLNAVQPVLQQGQKNASSRQSKGALNQCLSQSPPMRWAFFIRYY